MANKKTTAKGQCFPCADSWGLPEPVAPQPVTVLGLTFASDDERRQHFRDILRQKLPALRHIEGFPIGTDDDIIALSDPPYYTACPNPWLADFIAEWEADKQRLEAESKRYPNVQVNEPYAADVSEGKNNPVYTAHTYHTKVPHPAIMRYLLHYTQPGDIVFDGFAGTGMTGVAAAACANDSDAIAERINAEWEARTGHRPQWGARHAICGDLSPYATNIAYFYNTPIAPLALRQEVERIQTEMEEELGWMYRTTDSHGNETGRISFVVWSDLMICPHCGKEYTFWDQAVSHEQKAILDQFPCPHCHAMQTKRTAKTATETYFDDALGLTQTRVRQVPVIVVAKAGKEKIQRAPNEYDLKLLKKIEETPIGGRFPNCPLPEGQKTRDPKAKEIYYIHQFYTRRNLIALARLYEKIEASKMAHALRFMFTGMINRSTKMNRVHIDKYFHGGGGWNGGYLTGTLYVPNAPTETSVLEQIGDKLSAMLRAEAILPSVRPNAQYVGSADALLLPPNSVDYIFTDPPFGANINYSELNSLPEPWLRVVTNNVHEAIENPAQGKTAQTYRDTMARCYAEYYRILKPGRWMTVEFSNTSAAVWNSIQQALGQAGFLIAGVAALDKKQGSFNAVTTTTAVKQDLIISCFKPSESLMHKFVNKYSATNVWDFIDELLRRLPVHLVHDNKTTSVVERSAKILFDRLVSFYVQHGLDVPLSAHEFQRGLSERFVARDDMWFTASQVVAYDEKKRSTSGFTPSMFFIDSEQGGIAWLTARLGESPRTVAELRPEWMKALEGSVRRRGDIIPELVQILEENFIEMDDGRWRRPNMQDDVDLVAMRTKKLLREFKAYAEMARKPKGKIPEARLEALRAGFQQCYHEKDFATILSVAGRIPQALLTEDPQLLRFYDVALKKS